MRLSEPILAISQGGGDTVKPLWKRIGVLCLTAALAVALLPAGVFATEATTSTTSTTSQITEGSENNPYQIAKPEDFDLLRQHPEAYFKLTQDIDMKDVSFTPIAEPFLGTLMGNNKTISNLKIEGADAALFLSLGYKGKNQQGVVQDLVFKKADIKGTSSAAVVAVANSGVISNVRVEGGTVLGGTGKATDGIAGAIAATQSDATGTIKKCIATADVKGGTAGGLVGVLEAGTLEACYAGGTAAGAVFGTTTSAKFTAADVFYTAGAAVGTKETAAADGGKSKVEPYTGKGFIGMTAAPLTDLQQGAKGEAPVTLDAKPTGKGVKVSYKSDAPKVLKVDAATGAYEAVSAGNASYIYTLSLADSVTYAIWLPTIKVAAVANDPASSTPPATPAQGTVVVKHLEKDTTEPALVEEATLTGTVGEDYKTEPATIENYELSGTPENAAGKYAAEPQTVIYYYTKTEQTPPQDPTPPPEAKEGSVLVKHLEKDTDAVVSPEEPFKGKVGDAYTTAHKTPAGYTYDSVAGAVSGTYLEESQTVTYYYVKAVAGQGSVLVKYLEADTGIPVADSVKLSGKVGEAYSTKAAEPAPEGYTPGDLPENATGVYTAEEQTVTYLYTKNAAVETPVECTVLVQFWEKGTDKALAEPVTLKGEADVEYVATPAAVEGYTPEAAPENAAGTYKSEAQTVTFYYAKNPPAPEDIEQGTWRTENGKRYYMLADGTKATGPQVIDDLYYIFDENGAVYRFQFFYDSAWYLADDTGSIYRNSFLTGKTSRTFYDMDGAAKTGWIDGPDNKQYYQRVSDTIGFVLATGVTKTDKGVCLFDKEGARNTGTGWFDGVHLQDGIVSAGKQTIDGKTYVFKEDGTVHTGEFTYGGTAYCADEAGVLYLDAFRTMPDGTLRYYDANGQATAGWKDRADGRYYQNSNLAVLTGRQSVGSVIYFFGSDGKLSTTDGWAGDYYVRGGEAVTGMQQLNGNTYYFGTDGLVVRGAFTYNEAKYCGDENGALRKNAVAYEADGTGAYYGADGKAVAGWVTLGNDKYYQLPTLVLATGKHVIDGTAYFFTAEGKQLTGDGWAGNYYVKSGKVVTGKQTIGDGMYVFSDEGSVYRNDFTWQNGTYCADATGKLYTDTIRTVSGGLRYFGKDGKAPTGWIETNGNKYYQADNLLLLTGKQVIGGKTYYFGDTGIMITAGWVGGIYVLDGMPAQGPQTVDGKQYIFSETGTPYKYTFTYNNERYLASGTGVLYTNCMLTSEGKTTYYGMNGAAPTGWFTLGGGARYYQTKDYQLLTGQQKIDNKLYFFGSDGKLKTDNGWAGDYYVVDGAALTGMQTLDGADYYFNEEGLVQRGEIKYENANYFADGKGAIQKDYTRTLEDGTLRYHDADGKAVTKGWFTRGESADEYYQGEDLILAVGKKTIDNKICFFEADGKRKTTDGWAGDYYVEAGVAVTGEKTIEGVRYIFNEEGAVQKGDFTFADATYYGDPKTGALLLNAIHATTGGNRYHDADGKAVQGWIELDGAKYYQDDKLLLVTGRQLLTDEEGEEGLYYFATDGKLKTGDGWADDYYLIGGKVLTGPQTIDEVKYVFNDDGLVQKNHFQYHNVWYCADETGVLVLSAIRTLENGKQRYFDENGAAMQGFATLGEDTYYQNAEANLVTGRHEIDGKMYYFGPDGKQQKGDGWFEDSYLENGVPVTGKRDIEGKAYIFDDNGQVKKGEFIYGGFTYWADTNGALFTDTVCTRDNGTRAYMNEYGAQPWGWSESPKGHKYYQEWTGSSYVISTGFVTIDGDTYYFMWDGKLFAGHASGWYLIDGKQYYLLTDGRYCAPPAITAVKTAHDASKKLYSVTIESGMSGAAGTNPAGSFSFDGGLTWQASNVITVEDAKGLTIGAGKIRVRDGIGQIVQYNQTVYLAPIVTIPGGSGNSGPGSYGIDVSMYNGSINWPAVKASGINFAIIRATSANNAGYYVDPYFESNVRNAKAAGIDVGLYIYSYARSYQDVADEVNFFINSQQARNLKASGITLDYPVYVDYEDNLNLKGTSYDQRTDYVRQMMVQLKNAGYYPGFYTYHAYRGNFNVGQLVNEGYDFWYARYPKAPDPPSNPSGSIGVNVSVWQYCSDGNTNPAMKPYVNGIYTSLDLNYVYDDVPTRVHKFYGTGSSTTPPNAPDGVVTPDVLTVYDMNSSRVVTDNAANILARIVQTEVGGFNNAEVYKAQAIAAHSYIMFQAQRGATPTVALSSPSSAVQAAVNDVADKIVTYGGTVANAMYGAANSGKTYSSQGMWGGSYPYLAAGIDSPGDLSATQYANGGISWQNRTNTIKLGTMVSNIEKMVPGSTSGRSDYQNWITNPEYDGDGYLTYITVMNTRVKAGKFFDNCWGLYSPNFSMQYNGNGTWNFVTRGNGHCVGMSQWGAYGFARQGWNYTQILSHYYPGTQIANLR